MSRSTGGGGLGYAVRFGLTAALLVTATLVLVLWVLPERYVLSSGFQESGVNPPSAVIPFQPDSSVGVAARALPGPVPPTPRGPQEILWDEVLPLLGQRRYDAAISRFRDYLASQPGDRAIRGELAVTLIRANRREEAVAELRRLLRGGEDLERRLLLARTLRDLSRTAEADSAYARVVAARTGDVDLWLERTRNWSWATRYPEAADVLGQALALHPESVPLRIEMARVRFATGELELAAAQLDGIDRAALADAEALDLRDLIAEALLEPEPPEVPSPTLLEQAVQAREADEFARSARLFARAVDEAPNDAEVREAFANLLEYELEDFSGARDQLLELERRAPNPPDSARVARQYRLARLESWTGSNREAHQRLEALLPTLAGDAPVSSADVRALLGDLERFDGDRVAAGRQYRAALETDGRHPRAMEGLAHVRAQVDTLVRLEERPGLESLAFVGDDTDDFVRWDVGGQAVQLRGDWVWRADAGARWLDGVGLAGTSVSAIRGTYAGLGVRRWWRWGTIRTGIDLGVQEFVDDTEFTASLSVGYRSVGGTRTDVEYERGPAYPVTATLQSFIAGVAQDVLRVRHTRALGARWELAGSLSANRLGWDEDRVVDSGNSHTVRLEGSTTLRRIVDENLQAGVLASVTGVTDAAPLGRDGAVVGRRLFWDPRLALLAQPFVRARTSLGGAWRATGQFGAGVALIDERDTGGWEFAPQLSVEAGLWRDGDRFRVGLELFSYQGQFDEYRFSGARLTFGTRALPWAGVGR